jgi:hypothetical protein
VVRPLTLGQVVADKHARRITMGEALERIELARACALLEASRAWWGTEYRPGVVTAAYRNTLEYQAGELQVAWARFMLNLPLPYYHLIRLMAWWQRRRRPPAPEAYPYSSTCVAILSGQERPCPDIDPEDPASWCGTCWGRWKLEVAPHLAAYHEARRDV